MSRIAVGLLASVCLVLSLASVSLGQDAKEAKPSLKAKGRLPAYFKDVVTPAQRDSIYKLQIQYNDQIRKLAEEMKALTEKRDAEIEALLSAEQKAKVEALRADAKKKSAAASNLKRRRLGVLKDDGLSFRCPRTIRWEPGWSPRSDRFLRSRCER